MKRNLFLSVTYALTIDGQRLQSQASLEVDSFEDVSDRLSAFAAFAGSSYELDFYYVSSVPPGGFIKNKQ